MLRSRAGCAYPLVVFQRPKLHITTCFCAAKMSGLIRRAGQTLQTPPGEYCCHVVVILHSGQTGVERGAQRAAKAIGFPVSGIGTADLRDELGPLPGEIARDLIACPARGPRSAALATLDRAELLVVVVPTVRMNLLSPGLSVLIRKAKQRGTPHVLVDSHGGVEAARRGRC